MINLIACIDSYGGLGIDNQLLYHIPEDLKRFKQLTSNQVVVFGRKTYESIISMNGKALPNRTNIILTRDKNYQTEYGGIVVNSVDDILSLQQLDKEVWICGGSELYSLMLPYADNIYLTVVHETHKVSDTLYPLDKQATLPFTLESNESRYSDRYNAIYSFKKYTRNKLED